MLTSRGQSGWQRMLNCEKLQVVYVLIAVDELFKAVVLSSEN
jgi:hypothetical protein